MNRQFLKPFVIIQIQPWSLFVLTSPGCSEQGILPNRWSAITWIGSSTCISKIRLDDQWTDVGYGAVDFKSVFQIIKAKGRDDIYSTVERDEVLPDALESACRSMAKIREMGL